jgi:uncharacterized protein (TIGR02246 family)
MTTRRPFLIAIGLSLVLTIACLTQVQLTGRAGEEKGKGENAGDAEAIKKADAAFLKAYMAGDAKALAAHWTENGEYYADDGTIIRGRGDIEKAFAKLFTDKKLPGEAVLDTTSLRFPSKDTAIEEGYFKVQRGKDAPTAGKYSLLHVRENGDWRLAVVREWPHDGPSLRDLEWLIGTWEAKRNDTEIQTTYEWWGDKSFIRVAIILKEKGRTREGFQMIAKDRSTGRIRSWTFDPEGSFAEATWTQDGNKWSQDSAAVLDDGGVIAATHILARIDNDTFTFQSVQRSLNGEDADDIPAVRVTRVKGK